MSCGERANSVCAHTVTAMTDAIVSTASENPIPSMAATHNGENTTPPTLPPLYAMASAGGRRCTNHGETIAFTAAALMAPHPAPVSRATTNSCHGATAMAQLNVPTASATTPACVTGAAPNRRSEIGLLCGRAGIAITAWPRRPWLR